MRIGLALNCEIRPSIFHRKNYFYPDMPKDYQVSQYDAPINVNGWLELPDAQPSPDRAGPHGGGHRQDLARRGRGAHPRRRLRARRLQPRRGAAGGDRVRPRHPVFDPGPPLRLGAPGHPRRHRGVGRSHGGGVDARRRQRVGAARRDLRARHALRDQEPELAAVARQGHRVRDRAAGRVARGRRQGHPADSALERGRRGSPSLCARKRRPSTTGTSPSPTSCPSCPTPVGSRRWPLRSGPCPPTVATRSPRCWGPSRCTRARADQIATVVEHGLDGLVTAAAAAGVDGALALARTANEASADPDAARRLDASAFIALLRMEQDGKLSATQAKTVLADMLENGGDPAEIARRRGFEALDTDSLSRRRGGGRRRPSRRVAALHEPARTSSSASSPGTSCGPPATGPTARRSPPSSAASAPDPAG